MFSRLLLIGGAAAIHGFKPIPLVGEVGADPTTPEETDLQSAAVADLLLPEIYWRGGEYFSLCVSNHSNELLFGYSA